VKWERRTPGARKPNAAADSNPADAWHWFEFPGFLVSWFPSSGYHRYTQVPSCPQDAGIQCHGRQLQAILAAWIRFAVCGSCTNLSGTDLH